MTKYPCSTYFLIRYDRLDRNTDEAEYQGGRPYIDEHHIERARQGAELVAKAALAISGGPDTELVGVEVFGTDAGGATFRATVSTKKPEKFFVVSMMSGQYSVVI